MREHIKAATGKRRPRLDDRVMKAVGREWCGNSAPPLDNRTAYVAEGSLHRVFCTLNDGHDVGIGYPDQWQVIMSRRSARLLAWWVFRSWLADLGGLRSAVYYRALNHKCHGTWKAIVPIREARRRRREVRWSSYDEWRARRGAA